MTIIWNAKTNLINISGSLNLGYQMVYTDPMVHNFG